MTNHNSIDILVTNIANKLAFIGAYGAMLSALVFTYFFPMHRTVKKSEILIVVGLSMFVILVTILTDSISGSVTIDRFGNLMYPVGDMLWTYVVCLLVILSLITRNLLTVSKKRPIRRQQAKYILLAFVLSVVVGLLTNLILPLVFSNWEFSRLSPVSMIILVAIVAYTIIKHGLFDMRLAVVRGVAYLFALITLAALYYFIAFSISEVVFHDTALINQGSFSIYLALVLAFIFQPIKNFFDKFTSKVFYKDNYSIGDFFARLSELLSVTTDLHTILHQSATAIADTVKSEYAYFQVRYGNNRHITAGAEVKSHITPSDTKAIDKKVINDRTIIITDDLDETEESLQSLLRKHDIAIVLPLFQKDKLLGYLFLGNQLGGSYTRRDIRALDTVSDELAIAIQNALSIQEVKEINETLQERIADATKELRASNAQLQRLDAAKDEFVSMASHQLRTPLTSVKGYISMMLEGDVGKVTPTQRRILAEAFTSSERMVHLISDFLNVSRIQTGKFIVERRKVDLARIVSKEVDGLKTIATAHKLKLKYRPPSYFPILYVDESKIRQVMMNFIDNAIFYSHENSTIDIDLKVQGGEVVFKVHDTGIGVPKSEQAHLFTKFFRATNARKQRPDGTGVGLYLAKKIIDSHDGKMILESVEDEGSTFGFRLPIKKLSQPDSAKDSD